MSALRRLRVNAKLSGAQLAELSGISEDQILNIESGKTRSPRVTTLVALADVLRVEPADIDPKLTNGSAAQAD